MGSTVQKRTFFQVQISNGTERTVQKHTFLKVRFKAGNE